jgi:hypothetical protein
MIEVRRVAARPRVETYPSAFGTKLPTSGRSAATRSEPVIGKGNVPIWPRIDILGHDYRWEVASLTANPTNTIPATRLSHS